MHIQLLLEEFNALTMGHDSNVVDHVNHMALVAKDFSVAGNPILDKMHVCSTLNSLPPSWDSIVTFLNCLNQDLSMDSLPAILTLKEERKTEASGLALWWRKKKERPIMIQLTWKEKDKQSKSKSKRKAKDGEYLSVDKKDTTRLGAQGNSVYCV